MSQDERRATARLLARLLLREIDADLVRALEEPAIRDALGSFGLVLPSTDSAALDALAAEYFEHFVNPAGAPPPVQSLIEGGTYEGDAATGVRAVAEAAGVAFDASEARGAPPDHLGCSLLLWDELAGRDPAAAEEFAKRHLAWAPAHLRSRRPTGADGAGGFYDRLALVVADFVDDVTSAPEAAGE